MIPPDDLLVMLLSLERLCLIFRYKVLFLKVGFLPTDSYAKSFARKSNTQAEEGQRTSFSLSKLIVCVLLIYAVPGNNYMTFT